ncbi:hypothetical protein [Parerythrobacter lacustris]|uniref:DUF4268 domain-containing protein n=1 Tax=Parerythrobacter lacustris TaxID=2969984 RepID=A0ABT1XR58_9SPHN|nr:hypothetical protein [Parerythrobacter lacustris]MCR2834139.1 hypothetical protein [Parerythrobacter lacustris]
MDKSVYIVETSGLREMKPAAPANEDHMQDLVARYPQLIAGEDQLLLIAREASIGDGTSDNRWSLDHLFVTRRGVPVMVELKRAVDTRLRREVVGQLIDYAANGTAHWKPGAIEAAFRSGMGEPEAAAALEDFLDGEDASDFWQRVESNLQSGQIKLVFVADRIPDELAVVVEWLDSQMQADVRAVELSWYADEHGVTTLVPRTIGASAKTLAKKGDKDRRHYSLEEWIEERISPKGQEKLKGVQIACAIAQALDGKVFVPATAGSIIGEWETDDGRSCYPFGVYPSAKVVLRLGYLKNRPAYENEQERQMLYESLLDIVGNLHTSSLAGEPGFDAELLLNPKVADAYREFLHDVVEMAKRAPSE